MKGLTTIIVKHEVLQRYKEGGEKLRSPQIQKSWKACFTEELELDFERWLRLNQRELEG